MSRSTEASPVVVSLAEIARIAGVGRAAVSNWRRRHENFPVPVGGTDTSPQFSLSEVELWLQQENKLKATANPLDRLWPEFEAVGDRDTSGLLVARVGLRLGGAPAFDAAGETVGGQHGVALVERALELDTGHSARTTFHLLLERWLRVHVRQIVTTPPRLAELMVKIAALQHPGNVRTILDPACGSGTLLASAGRHWRGATSEVQLLGQDSDHVLTELTRARLAAEGLAGEDFTHAVVGAGDTLRADAHAGTQADVVLCNPPANERDWGHAELATDPRWVYGQPPRTEPELAWIQHATAALAPGGVAVLVVPPSVAARRAGRRIRSGLMRSGVLRAVIALPPGAAPPYGVGLHLWVLRAKGAAGTADEPLADGVTLIDTVRTRSPEPHKGDVDWSAITEQVTNGLSGTDTVGCKAMPVVDLLDDQVDLTPARHIPRTRAATIVDLRQSWSRFDTRLRELRDLSASLSELVPEERDEEASFISVGELERAGALEIRSGQTLPEDLVRRGERQEGEARVLAGAPLSQPAQLWLSASAVAKGEQDGSLTVTASQDVVVSVLARAFDVQVDTDVPSVLGPNLSALRANPAVLDAWFLAGCLRAPGNVQRAGTHASTTSRVDVRRLQVPRLSLEAQRRYGEICRRITSFERGLRETSTIGAELGQALGDLLATGELPHA
ncbi:N-6 DNA methylase [Streptomyces tendae]